MTVVPPPRRPAACPPWCARHHGRHPDDDGEDDTLHVSGALMVRHTVLRLCMTSSASTGEREGPYVLVGAEEYSVHEAEALIDALTQLVDRSAEINPRAGA